MSEIITEHNHTDVTTMGGCPACASGHTLEDDTAPPGCTYELVKTPIDDFYACRRHKAVDEDNNTERIVKECISYEEAVQRIDAFFATYTGPCFRKARMDRASK